jgi:hypothetical protein
VAMLKLRKPSGDRVHRSFVPAYGLRGRLIAIGGKLLLRRELRE